MFLELEQIFNYVLLKPENKILIPANLKNSEYVFVTKLIFPGGFVRYPITDGFYTDFDKLIM